MEGEKDKHFNGLTSATLETHLTDSNGIVAAANIESTRNVSDEPLTSSCGWSLVHPACLQRFAIPKCLLFWLCWAATLQGMIVNGFVNVVITTIERRFELRSIETGIIAGSYDIASVLCLIPVSYFGGTACKPLWIGCGMVVMGLGSLIFAIPHFATPIYTAISDNQILCRETILQSASETMEGSCWSLGALSNYKYIFIMAQLLHGIGAAPLYTLGVILLDDNFTTKMASVYIGDILDPIFIEISCAFIFLISVNT